MNHTIYFRKGVWGEFEKEEKKSELVNQLLERHYSSPTRVGAVSQSTPSHQTFTPKPTIIKTPKEATMAIDADYKPCKHGAHPQFCKFSKPGKPCKAK